MENIVYEYHHDKDTNLTIQRGLSTFCRPHFHRSIEILYVFEGKMLSEVGEKTFTAMPDDIVFVHNYYRHAFTPCTSYKKIFLVIPYNYGNDFDAVFQHCSLPGLLDDKEFNRKNLRPIFKKMYEERETMPPLVKKGYLNVILGNMFGHYPTVPVEKNGNIDFLVSVLNYIDVNYANPITLDSIAATFGYNKYYFSRLFNKYIGENITNYINIVRLQHFMNKSKDEEPPSISELAFSCGFDSLTTFYRYFNKIYADNPKTVLNANKNG